MEKNRELKRSDAEIERSLTKIIDTLLTYANYLSTRPGIVFDPVSQKILEHIYQTITLLNSEEEAKNKVFKIEVIAKQLSIHTDHARINEIVETYQLLKNQLSDENNENNEIRPGFRNRS